MNMRPFATLLLAGSLMALAACGNKDASTPEAPAPQAVAPAVETPAAAPAAAETAAPAPAAAPKAESALPKGWRKTLTVGSPIDPAVYAEGKPVDPSKHPELPALKAGQQVIKVNRVFIVLKADTREIVRVIAPEKDGTPDTQAKTSN